METAEYAEFNVPTCGLQFVSYAEKDKVFSRQCPCSGPTDSPIFPGKSRMITASQKLKLIHHASIHPVHFGEFSFAPTHGQLSRNHVFLRSVCLP